MNKKTNLIIWIIAICVVMVAAYTFYSKNKTKSAVPPLQQNSPTNQTSQENKPIAPDFSLKDINGKTVKLSDYKGKIVILNFWFADCIYCKQEMPDINELNKTIKKENKAVIITVNCQDSLNVVKNYLSSNNFDLKVLLDQTGSVSQTYGVTGFPTTFILNKDGSLYTNFSGATNKETLMGILDKIHG